ncbi:MAG: helix-turn-helix transcriptional regulator [Gemmatimonadota bacterium]|jgi:PadR family transcriptional regulator, regulatory protein PadR
MAKREHLGEFEQLVLLAVAWLDGAGYGVTIRREIARRSGRRASVAAVYGTLDRLASKGYVSTRMGEATPERGGRAKRYYRLERAGARALMDARTTLDRMWAGLDADALPGQA